MSRCANKTSKLSCMECRVAISRINVAYGYVSCQTGSTSVTNGCYHWIVCHLSLIPHTEYKVQILHMVHFSASLFLSQDDPLGKVMDLFAAKLGVPVDRIKFSFDGDPVNAKQTADDLGLEDEDALDARVT